MSKLFVITGPSGVGKNTIAESLLKRCPNLTRLVTCTTRPPRPNEQDGIDYHFLTDEEFQETIDRGNFLEWAPVYDYRYGSRRADLVSIFAQGKDALMVVGDVPGAAALKKLIPEVTLIGLIPESPEILAARRQKRDQGQTVGLEARQAAVAEEIDFCKKETTCFINRENMIEETVDEIAQKIGCKN